MQFLPMSSPAHETSENVVFHDYGLILKRRWFPFAAVAVSIFGASSVLTMLQQPIYQAEGKILLSKTDRVSSLTDITAQTQEITGLTQTSSPLDTEAEIVQSGPLLEKTIASLKLTDATGQPLELELFQKPLKVKGLRGTDILTISYQGHRPQDIAAIVNALMRHYIENNIRENRAEAVAAREFIRKQLPDVEARVRKAEMALRQFKSANQVVDLDTEAKVSVQGLHDLTDKIAQVQAKLADATSRTTALQAQIGLDSAQAISLTSLNQSAAVQQVLADYRKVQDEIAVQTTRWQPEHPGMKQLMEKEAALQKQLEVRIAQALPTGDLVSDQDLQMSVLKQTITQDLAKTEAERLGLASQVQVLSTLMTAYTDRASALPQLEQNQRELERRLQVARSTYEQLLKRLQEVELAENQNVGNARIVSAARVPKQAIAPKKMLNFALGGLFGMVTGVLAALVLEAKDKSVKTVAEAQHLAGFPLLGVIPLAMGKAIGWMRDEPVLLPVRDRPSTLIGSRFELLQTTLGFTVSDHPLRTLVVTSAVDEEGKSFIAANLAIAMAQAGRRVLLIDADLRQPSQHTIWQPNGNEPSGSPKGLSDILVGQAHCAEVVSSPYANVDVLMAGTTPPNPMALIDSNRLVSLIATMLPIYDLIILDAPALTVSPDALALGKLVDGHLFTVRPGVADSAAVTQAKTLLEQSGQRILGMVVNGISADRGTSKSTSLVRSQSVRLSTEKPVPKSPFL
jgi:polysaccharide biosynthesis transport protein